MICNRKYHFVVPSRETEAVFGHDSNYEGPDSRKGERSIVGVEGHAMHGVIHSNGFGHLLCVNGLEMGSDLAGRHIMDFWDRLCTSLRARSALLLYFGHMYSHALYTGGSLIVSFKSITEITILSLCFICMHAAILKLIFFFFFYFKKKKNLSH